MEDQGAISEQKRSFVPAQISAVDARAGRTQSAKKERKSESRRPSGNRDQRKPLSPAQKSLRRTGITLFFVGFLTLAGLVLLRYDMTPETVRVLHPVVGTQVAEAHLRLAPAPTAFPVNNWMRDATNNRYENRIVGAAGLLRQGIVTEPDNLEAQFMLSDILREQPETAGESLSIAQQAASQVTNLEERAYAAQALVWAIAAQPAPDVPLAEAVAGQAVMDVPNSPHAQWARAMAAAMTGNAGEAHNAAALASKLDSGLPPAVAKARRAEIAQRLNEPEEAIQLYESALAEVDYVPWRAQVIVLLRSIGRGPEAALHLEALQTADPDNPLLIAAP
jgi:hypothetical protein